MKTLEEYKMDAENNLKKRDLIIKERWENLKPFETCNDVPRLPNPLTAFYVEKLIKAGAIPKKYLIDGQKYYGECRNADEAIWDEKRKCFIYKRNKFGYTFDEDINHFEDDNGFDLFVPLKLIK